MVFLIQCVIMCDPLYLRCWCQWLDGSQSPSMWRSGCGIGLCLRGLPTASSSGYARACGGSPRSCFAGAIVRSGAPRAHALRVRPSLRGLPALSHGGRDSACVGTPLHELRVPGSADLLGEHARILVGPHAVAAQLLCLGWLHRAFVLVDVHSDLGVSHVE